MSEDGTSFTIDLPVTNQAGVDAAAASVLALAANLDVASKASVAAQSAVGGTEASYRQAEQAADRAAKALERIGLAADAQRGKLKTAMDTGDTSGAEKAAAKLQALTARQAEAAAQAAKTKTAMEAEAKALDKVAEATKKDEKEEEGGEIKFEALERGLHKLGGPLGEVGAKVAGLGAGWGKLQKAVGSAGPEVAAAVLLAALAAALFAAAAAAVVATLKIAAWAVGLADANRTAGLLSQGIARSVQGGELLNDKIDQLTKTLPLTREELSSTAEKLANAGLRGAALTAALEKSATAAAKLKFGPDFGKEMLSLDQQSKVFHENLAGIFGGLKIDGLLEALQKLVGLFDADSASGRAMKVVFESLFQPLIDWLAKSEPKIEGFFLKLEIWALKALIAIKPYGSTILKVGEAFAIVAALLVGAVLFAVGVIVAAFALPIAALTAVVFGVIKAGEAISAAFTKVKAFLANFSLADIGKAMVEGLVTGIKNAAGGILDAMKGAVTGAVDAAKHALGIASPSKVFAEIGMQTGAGMTAGVDRSAAGVQTSLEAMVAPPRAANPIEGAVSPPAPGAAAAAAAAPAAPAGGGNKGGGVTGNTFILNGVEGADDAVARIGALLTQLIEGDVSQLGGAVPGNV